MHPKGEASCVVTPASEAIGGECCVGQEMWVTQTVGDSVSTSTSPAGHFSKGKQIHCGNWAPRVSELLITNTNMHLVQDPWGLSEMSPQTSS